MKYTYYDNSKTYWVPPEGDELHGHYVSHKIFECFAESILEADNLCHTAMKDGTIKFEKPPKVFDLGKMGYIGCTVGLYRMYNRRMMGILYFLFFFFFS